MGYTSYSRKGRRQRNIKLEPTTSISLSPSSHNNVTSSPIVRSSCLSSHDDDEESPISTTDPLNTSPLRNSPIIDSPSQRLRSATRRSRPTKLSDVNVFDVEDLGEIDYIPSFKRRSTYKVSSSSSSATASIKNTTTTSSNTKAEQKQNSKDKQKSTIETVHVEPIKLNGINDLDTRFYIESNTKPTWSPSKQLKSPIKLSSSKQSSPKLPKRTLCFDPPTTYKKEQSMKPAPVSNSESEAWSLFNEIEIDCKPKLISKSTKTKPNKKNTFNTETDQFQIQNNVIDEMYEKLITTPTKKTNVNPVPLKKDSPSLDNNYSPKKQKTYSAIRSFRADMTEEEEDDDDTTTTKFEEEIDDGELEKDTENNKVEIQDINQLRINGINSKFNEEFEYLIEGLYKNNINLTRCTILEICNKIMQNGEFYENLNLSEIPDTFLQSMLSTDDIIVQFCFLVICYKLRQNDQLILKLSRNCENLNKLLAKTSKGSIKDLKLKLNKVSQSILNELLTSLEREFENADTKFFHYLFLKTFKDDLKFEFQLVQLDNNTNEEELFVKLSILENMLQQDDNVPRDLFQDLICLITKKNSMDQTMMRSCQISALKSLILLSLSQPEYFNDTEFINDLFLNICENFNSDDNLTQNIVLLQAGLILNLISRLEPTGKEAEILSLVELNIANRDSVHICGYISLILGSLCMMQKLELGTHQRDILVSALLDFEKILVNDDEDLILQKIKHVLKFFST